MSSVNPGAVDFSPIRSHPLLSWIERFLLEHPTADLYVVGGAVRDLLRGRQVGDFDLVIGGVEPDKLEAWLGAHGTVSFVGKRFGVWKFAPHHDPTNPCVDIALPRKDVSIGESGGYRQFLVESDPNLPIKEDLARRDFSVNAIAYDWRRGELIDPFGGQADLKAQLIRTVGSPAERFREDSSRLLRAIRFACTLGFSIEPTTWSVLGQMVPRLSLEINGKRVVARELMAEEFVKSLEADPARCLELYQASGAWDAFLAQNAGAKLLRKPIFIGKRRSLAPAAPAWDAFLASSPNLGEVPQRGGGVFKKQHTNLSLEYLPFYSPLFESLRAPQSLERPRLGGEATCSTELLIIILCHDVFKSVSDAYDWLHLWRFEMQADVKAVVAVVRALKTDPAKVSLAQIERQLLPHRELLAEALIATGHPGAKVWFERLLLVYQRHEMPSLLTTDDLKNIPDGPKRGEVVNAVRSAQLAGEIVTRAEALEYLASSPNLGEVPAPFSKGAGGGVLKRGTSFFS